MGEFGSRKMEKDIIMNAINNLVNRKMRISFRINADNMINFIFIKRRFISRHNRRETRERGFITNRDIIKEVERLNKIIQRII